MFAAFTIFSGSSLKSSAPLERNFLLPKSNFTLGKKKKKSLKRCLVV